MGYADDLVVILKGNSRGSIEERANIVALKLKPWCDDNKLKISAEKKKYVLFKGKLNRSRRPMI